MNILQVGKIELGNKPKKMGGQPEEGIARCTFEDKILMSDIVFLRAWTQVDVPCFYNPLTTALQPRSDTWRGVRTVGELRREYNLPVPNNKDSHYKVVYICLVFVFHLSVKVASNLWMYAEKYEYTSTISPKLIKFLNILTGNRKTVSEKVQQD